MTEPAASESGLVVERSGPVAFLVLDRPAKRNAIDQATRRALASAAAALDADDDVRVVVLTGNGTAFCAGVDLKEQVADGGHYLASPPPPLSAPLDAMSKPLIAAINGPAVGGGLELALACDLRIASHTATFALPEVRVGSLPGSGGTQRIFSAVSSAVAWKMLLTGEEIDAAEALRTGLVSDLFEPADLRGAAEQLAQRIASNAPLSLAAAKTAGRAALGGDSTGGRALERLLWAYLATTEDRQEGRAAFRERRPPRFRGR